MTGLIIYLAAGISLAWSYDRDAPWQRGLMVVAWPVMIGYGMVLQFIDWWRAHGYEYDDDDEGSQ